MDFSGKAKKLDDLDLPMLGHKLGVGEDHIHMFLDVETLGQGHDSQGRSTILFERHIFYRELNKLADKSLLKKAVAQGLANKRAGGYGKTSVQYAKLARALKIHKVAALRSCSWGLGQVMGFNHVLAGYDTVEAMVLAFKDDEENQLGGAVSFILNSKLDGKLRACKPNQPETCREFAAGYNGSGYSRNDYHTKLAYALGKWCRIKDTPWSPKQRTATVLPSPQAPDAPPATEVPAATGWAAIFAAISALFRSRI
jgi:hypothetical protein